MPWTPMFMLIMSLEQASLRFSTDQYCHHFFTISLLLPCNSSVFLLYCSLWCYSFLQTKSPGVKSIISKASGSKADLLVEPGDKVSFGDLFLEVGMTMLVSLNLLFVRIYECAVLMVDYRLWYQRFKKEIYDFVFINNNLKICNFIDN